MRKTNGIIDKENPIAKAPNVFICPIKIEKIRYGSNPKAGLERTRFIKLLSDIYAVINL